MSSGSQISNEDMDIKINSGAVDAQLEWARQGHLVQKKKPSREDLEAFETAYNAACGSIARDELGQAEILLKRAKGRHGIGIVRSVANLGKICAMHLKTCPKLRDKLNFYPLLSSRSMS